MNEIPTLPLAADQGIAGTAAKNISSVTKIRIWEPEKKLGKNASK